MRRLPLWIWAFLAAAASAFPQSLLSPGHDNYPSGKNDPNHLWQRTPEGFWAAAPAFKAVPDGPPPGLTRAQRWKWADRAALAGTVVKIVDLGILVQCDPDPHPAPPATSASAVPRVYGVFLLKNYVSPHFLAVGDPVKVVAYPSGQYQDVDGSERRIYDLDIRDF